MTVSIPRPITGSPGSRIRLIFGENGNEWLLLLNNDNGNRIWQSKDWKGIPSAVAKQLNNCTEKNRDAKEVDFGPNGEWYVNGRKTDGSGGYSWWGGTNHTEQIKEWTSSQHRLQVSFGSSVLGSETCVLIQGNNGYSTFGLLNKNLEERVKKMNRRRGKINFVRLFNNGQFFISDDDGTEWSLNNNEHCTNELKKSGGKVEEVACAGDGSWVVIRENKYVASNGVDDELTKKLSKFFSDQRRWINDRDREIRDARAAEERERLARERAEQEAREAAERAERERVQREEREAEQAAQEAREAAERAERERLQREARERERIQREEAELDAATRISSLEAKLEDRLLGEAMDIKEMEEKLKSRKRSLHDALQSMPQEVRNRVAFDDEEVDNQGAEISNGNICVVCHDESAIMAVIPCGHLCLCSTCSDACMDSEANPRRCPLCRGNMTSVLRIYVGSS